MSFYGTLKSLTIHTDLHMPEVYTRANISRGDISAVENCFFFTVFVKMLLT